MAGAARESVYGAIVDPRDPVASIGEGAPAILLTDHLEGDRPILVYRVDRLEAALKDLEARGWTSERTIELPPGPACSLRTPGGHRIAVYEATRPEVVGSFAGRRDFS